MLQNYSTWRLFGVFADRPTRNFHLRELSRQAGLAPPSVRQHVKELLKEGIIQKDDSTLYPTYKAALAQEPYRFHKRLYLLERLRASKIIPILQDTYQPDVIILFGSAARGEDVESSDIDLFLQAKESRKLSAKEVESVLKRTVQLHFEEDLAALPEELANNILNGITLDGFARWTASSRQVPTLNGPRASNASRPSVIGGSLPMTSRKRRR